MAYECLKGLEPADFFHWFGEIAQIPHGSHKEEKLVAFLADFAKQRGFAYEIDETKNIIKTKNGAAIKREDGEIPVDVGSFVSMNMWGFMPDVFEGMQTAFDDFLDKHGMDMKAHYSIPAYVNQKIAEGNMKVKVQETNAKWMGLVSHDDKIQVLLRINEMIRKGIYPRRLFENFQ